MKALRLLLSIAAVTLITPAQTPGGKQSSPDIEIFNFSFEQKDVITSYWDRRDLQGRLVQSPLRAEDRFEPALGINDRNPHSASGLRYKSAVLEIKNDSSKTVKAVEWDLIYPRVVKGKVSLRFAVRSNVKMQPGETRMIRKAIPRDKADRCGVVVITSDRPVPTDRVVANGCGAVVNVLKGSDRERVSIKRIEYADGSVWQSL